MVGSEGTLAFLSEVTMKTEHDYPYSASAMLYFSNIKDACRAVVAMKPGPVFSAELLDKKSLASVNDTTGTGLTAVLTETKADTPEELQANIEEIKRYFLHSKPLLLFTLRTSPKNIRNTGLSVRVFPIGRRDSPAGYDRFDRRRSVSIERAARSDRRFTRVIGNE